LLLDFKQTIENIILIIYQRLKLLIRFGTALVITMTYQVMFNIQIENLHYNVTNKYKEKKEFIMSTFNMTTNTSSKIKDVSLALVLIGSLLGATLSTSVNAAPLPNVEKTVSDFIVAQGEKMIAELNTQLQQSINKEIEEYTVNFSFDNASTWLAAEDEKQTTPAVEDNSKEAN